MARIRASLSGGGGEVEWITPTLSGDSKSFSYTNDFPIETLLLLYSTTSASFVYMFDKNCKLWYANSGTPGKWQYAGDFSSYISFTNGYRTVNYTSAQNVAMSNVSMVLFDNKPNGYYT